jgi:hypothetical protein
VGAGERSRDPPAHAPHWRLAHALSLSFLLLSWYAHLCHPALCLARPPCPLQDLVVERLVAMMLREGGQGTGGGQKVGGKGTAAAREATSPVPSRGRIEQVEEEQEKQEEGARDGLSAVPSPGGPRSGGRRSRSRAGTKAVR